MNEAAFEQGGFLETVADQVTSREGIDGVYIIVAQTHANHPFASDSRVLRAYLHLARVFSAAGYSLVLVNFAGVFGQACMGAGATGFASGASFPTRRLSFEGFEEPGGGVALPRFYSNRTAGEYLTETDLDAIVARRLLRRVRDVTPYSEMLIEVLATGGSAAQIPAWAESQNNLGAASMHFVSRLASEATRLGRYGPRQRFNHVRDWLEDAAANALYLENRIGDEVKLRHGPCDKWLELLDESSQ